MEDYNALVYYVWKLMMYYGKSNSTVIATGAQSLSNDTGYVLQWAKSKELVDYSKYGMIRPAGNSTPTTQLPGQILFLQPVNFNKNYNPTFTLNGLLASDTSAEFICMKQGNDSITQEHYRDF